MTKHGDILTLGAVGLLAATAATRRGAAAVPDRINTVYIDSEPYRLYSSVTEARLRDALEDLELAEGYFGGGSSKSGIRSSHAFEFSVSEANPRIPWWVEDHGYKEYGSRFLEYVGSWAWDDQKQSIDWLMEQIDGPKRGPVDPQEWPLYQEWFTGEWGFGGHQGGYLHMGFSGLYTELEELIDEWPGSEYNDREPSIGLSGVRLNREYEQECLEALEKVEKALASVKDIQERLDAIQADTEEYWSSDERWRDQFDLTDADLARIKRRERLETAVGRQRRSIHRTGATRKSRPGGRAKRKTRAR